MLIEEGGVPHRISHFDRLVTALASVSLHADRPATARLVLLLGRSQKYTEGRTPGMLEGEAAHIGR